MFLHPKSYLNIIKFDKSAEIDGFTITFIYCNVNIVKHYQVLFFA